MAGSASTAHEWATNEVATDDLLNDMPKGILGFDQLTSNFGSIDGTESTILEASGVVVNSGRLILCEASGMASSDASGYSILAVRIYQDGTQIARSQVVGSGVAGYELGWHVRGFATGGAGTSDFKVTAGRIHGGDVFTVEAGSAYPSTLTIRDERGTSGF